MAEFDVKDSGERKQFAGGMQRDTTTGKIDYTLALDGPMFERYAAHLTKGAVKYKKRNWMLAEGEEELERFKESALRHFLQWYRGNMDEDHASAIWFNVNGAEYVKGKMQHPVMTPPTPHHASHCLSYRQSKTDCCGNYTDKRIPPLHKFCGNCGHCAWVGCSSY